MANTVPIEFSAEMSRLREDLDGMRDYIQGWGFHIKQSLSDLFTTKIFDGLLKGFETLKSAVEGWIEAAAEAEEVDKRLDIAVRNAGAGFMWTSGQLKEMASDMQEMSVFDDETIKRAETRLVQLGLTGKTFRDTMKAALEVAAGQPGSDLGASAESLARALAVPENAARALKGAGILLTAQQREQIDAFMKVGDAASAQGAILKAVTANYHDMALEMSGTWNGMRAQLRNLKNDAEEALGAGFLKLLEEIEPALKAILQHVKELSERFKEAFIGALGSEGGKNAINGIKDAVIGLFATVETFFARLPLNIESIFHKLMEKLHAFAADVNALMSSMPRFLTGAQEPWEQKAADQRKAERHERELGQEADIHLEQRNRGGFAGERDALAANIKEAGEKARVAAEERERAKDEQAKAMGFVDAMKNTFNTIMGANTPAVKLQERKAGDLGTRVAEINGSINPFAFLGLAGGLNAGGGVPIPGLAMGAAFGGNIFGNISEQLANGDKGYQAKIEDAQSAFRRQQQSSASMDPKEDATKKTAGNTQKAAEILGQMLILAQQKGAPVMVLG